MSSSVRLMYFNSDAIKAFVGSHPIDWMHQFKMWARRRGIGDCAGIPPVSNVEAFFALLSERKSLFTQEEYFDYCMNCWGEQFIESLEERPKVTDADPMPPNDWSKRDVYLHGLRAKAYRNFYPSCIDSLHAWAILVEWGNFDECILDTIEDVVGHVDITIKSNGQTYPIALHAGSEASLESLSWKQRYRGASDSIHIVSFANGTRQGIGRKMWYTPEDFRRAGLPLL